MSADLHFLPWLRTGLASLFDGSGPGADTLTVTPTLTARKALESGTDSHTFEPHVMRVQGPGSVVGLQDGQILRTSPAPGATSVEPNYFAVAELKTPDLPWRFTPGAPDAQNRLTPWLALVVVERRDGVRLTGARGNRLQTLVIDDARQELPPLKDAWAWAHVQYSGALAEDASDADTIEAAFASGSPDLRARLMCPRRLDPNLPYWACIVPTFEAGRMAGLGHPGHVDTNPAWTGSTEALTLPVYHSWTFTTGPRGDFESLVNRLEPREMEATVGLRPLTLRTAAGGLPDHVKDFRSYYAGALVSPAAKSFLEDFEAEHAEEQMALRDALTDLVNESLLAIESKPATDADPVVAPPAYGRTYRKNAPLAPGEKQINWYDELNSSVRHRAVAGLAAEMIRQHQEELVDKAWDAAGDVQQANMQLNVAQVALGVGRVAERRLGAMSQADRMRVSAPAFNAMSGVGTARTVNAQLHASAVPNGLFSGANRRITRAQTGLTSGGGAAHPGADVVAAFLEDPLGPQGRYRDVLSPAGLDPEATPAPSYQPDPSGGVGAIVLSFPTMDKRPRVQFKAPAGIEGLVAAVAFAQKTEPQLARALGARIPAVAAHPRDIPTKLEVAPTFRIPVYQQLRDLSLERLLPGAGSIPQDTVTLLYPNSEFMRTFLVAMNHEMAREFLWREVPTALDTTWFRHFWTTTRTDIEPIAGWGVEERLDGHDDDSDLGDEIILVIRGTLPLQYPDLRLYATRAKWVNARTDGNPLWYRDEDMGTDPVLPHLAGQLAEDIFFFGFRIAPNAAAGAPVTADTPYQATEPAGGAGYFFAFEEIPGSARFGLEALVPEAPYGVPPDDWMTLSWNAVTPEGSIAPARHLDVEATAWMRDGTGPAAPQWAADAAAIAYQTLQRPARVLMHASGLLPD